MDRQLSRNETKADSSAPKPLKFLDRSQIEMIDEALDAVGLYGEVHLIMDKGRLRFVVTKNSHDALKWHPGDIEDEPN